MRSRRPEFLPFDKVRSTGGDNVAPVLSSPDNGTETVDGTTNFGATTTKGGGGFYWAVTTDAGTATVEQIVLGTGGNIIADKAGRVNVTAPGVVTVAAVTGLSSATAYELFFVHVDSGGNRSASSTVGFTTL